MNHTNFIPFALLLAMLFVPSLVSADEAPPKQAVQAANDRPTSRTDVLIEGWTVRIDDRLFQPEHKALGEKCQRFLEAKLADIARVVPEDRLEALRKVRIVLDLNNGELDNFQYHPSAGWLKEQGYSPDLARCVHIPIAAAMPTVRNTNQQPWFILHELAHAYHHQVLGYGDKRIKSAYEKYKASGHGDETLLFNGKRVKHYALTNDKEFFAEMTESFFGVNDFYPFTRAELMDSEPEIHQLLVDIWLKRAPGVEAEPPANSSSKP
ncbi:MAG: metallopeptidase [Phycisphaera sp.]|nr:metallopeptidase [Phycisphaera sp.]